MATPSRFDIWPKVFTCSVCGTVSNASVHCVLPSSFDDGPDGALQCVLPGAERATDAAMAQRQADAPLKPKTAQRPCDAGLWSTDHLQTELKL